jgi:hypothetical protein
VGWAWNFCYQLIQDFQLKEVGKLVKGMERVHGKMSVANSPIPMFLKLSK